MKTVRKIDYCGQLILAILTILSVPFLLLPGFMAGLFIMACWQLISASVNTYSFIHSGFKRHIFLYWIFCIGDIAFLFLSFWLHNFFDPDDMQVMTWIAMAGGIVIAGYYFKIYIKLIEFVALKNELAGLLKSK